MIAEELPKRIATEGGRFYYPTGEPCDLVRGANGKDRPPTVKDARKLKLLPSVTTIARQVYKFELENWKLDKAIIVTRDVIWDFDDNMPLVSNEQLLQEVREKLDAELCLAS